MKCLTKYTISDFQISYSAYIPLQPRYKPLPRKLTIMTQINRLHATGLFLYPLTVSENVWFSDLFKGYRKTSGMKRVNFSSVIIALSDSFEVPKDEDTGSSQVGQVTPEL